VGRGCGLTLLRDNDESFTFSSYIGQVSASFRLTTATVLIGAGALGAAIGVGSLAMAPEGRADLAAGAHAVAVAAGIKRQRAPQPNDYWGGCNAARAAGTAPIYRGEPGYRPEMDGDGDGLACEPVRN
jgi:hypothetical protein